MKDRQSGRDGARRRGNRTWRGWKDMEGMEGSEGIKRTEGVDGTGGIDGTEGTGGINGMDRDGKMTFPMSNRIWVFTGGAHGAGGFSENRGFRNMAGLFEEVVRWDM